MRARFYCVIATAMTATAFAHADLTHHWKLDETSGTTAFDSIGAANGALGGASAWSAGKVGNGFKTTGFNLGYVNSGNVPITGSFALSFWVKPEDVSLDWRNMVSKHDIDGQQTFWVGQHSLDGRMRFGMYFDGTNETPLDTPAAVISSGQWAHVTAMWNETTKSQSLYVNGQLAVSATQTGKSNLFPRSSNLLFNTNSTSTSSTVGVGSWARFPGTLDDVALWDRTLPAGKIKAMVSTEAIPTLAGYNAADYSRLFDAYDTNFPVTIGTRRWKHATGLALGEGNAAERPNGHAIQMDSIGGGITALSTISVTADPVHAIGLNDSIGSGSFPMQLAIGDVFAMLWTRDTVGADDRAALRSELDAVSGAAFDVIGSTDPLFAQFALSNPGFDTLIRFNQAGVVGHLNWDFASHADIRVEQFAVVTTGVIPEPASSLVVGIACVAVARRRR